MVDTPVLEAGIARCESSSLSVRTKSTRHIYWEIVIPDVFRDPPHDLKEWLVIYLRVRVKMPELADRIEANRLNEEDMFFLNRFFPTMTAFWNVKPQFRIARW